MLSNAGGSFRCNNPLLSHPTTRRQTVPTVEFTKDTFEDAIMSNDMVLVDFWAEWCGPCRSFAPVYEKVSAEHPDVVFGKVDTEAQQELAGYFNIQSIPTLMIFRDNIGIFAQPGALPESALTDLIDQAQKVDMDDVRRQIAEETESESENDHDHDHAR